MTVLSNLNAEKLYEDAVASILNQELEFEIDDDVSFREAAVEFREKHAVKFINRILNREETNYYTELYYAYVNKRFNHKEYSISCMSSKRVDLVKLLIAKSAVDFIRTKYYHLAESLDLDSRDCKNIRECDKVLARLSYI